MYGDVGCYSLAMPQSSFPQFRTPQTSNVVSRITCRNLGSVDYGHNVFLAVDLGLVALLNVSMLGVVPTMPV